MRPFEYRHIVSLAETNVVGNVYFSHYLSWQGRCREMFLRAHAPDVLGELQTGLSLVTLRCSCEYLLELFAFDEIMVRMWLADRRQNRLTLRFDYLRSVSSGEELVAKGEQQVACMRREPTGLRAAPLPESLDRALRDYGG